MIHAVLLICGAFYAVLCVFSIVTGLLYAGGRRKLNPLELSERFLHRFSDPEKLHRFTIRMGWVTFFVGIVQGVTAWAVFCRAGALCYGIALGFTLFSLASVSFKLKGKRSAFAIAKCAAYAAILVVLLLPAVRRVFLA